MSQVPRKRPLPKPLSVEDTKRSRRDDSDDSVAKRSLRADTVRNLQQSPLLRLPGEIRSRIYEYALGGHTFTPAGEQRLYTDGPAGSQLDDDTWKGLQHLAQVCRQLREETQLLPYSMNIFRQHYHSSDALRDWTDTLGLEKQAEICRVEIWDSSKSGSKQVRKFLLPQLFGLPKLKQIIIKTIYSEWPWTDGREWIYDWAKLHNLTVVFDVPVTRDELHCSSEVWFVEHRIQLQRHRKECSACN